MFERFTRLDGAPLTPLDYLISFCIRWRALVALGITLVGVWGLIVAPLDWEVPWLTRDPVGADAIPDIGENQQIVFTEWTGRSPADVENQITYPLTAALLSSPGVKAVRGVSMFGFSSVYVIFNDNIDFYFSRTRILERLNSLPPNSLPEGVKPTLGPDATALGQVFWYTVEGHDSAGNVTGGWDLDELRSIQDWRVRYSLQSAAGVSEVASIGGHVREYQIDMDPAALRAFDVTIEQVYEAVRKSNRDVGARTIEVNGVSYVIRGLGLIRSVEDIESALVSSVAGTPVYVRNVATVTLGPAPRAGALDKAGAEAVGGVVVVRYGENPLAVIKRVKEKIAEIAPGLPSKTLANGVTSKVTITPFYDRTELIHETLATLNGTLLEETLVTVIVVVAAIVSVLGSALIAGLLPLAMLLCFIGMRIYGVDANIMALSGIAIAIGDIADMGIIVAENIMKRLAEAAKDANVSQVIFQATSEVGSGVMTSIATIVVGFLPVFTLEGAEGKLFTPLAYTKTFALVASVILALTVVPAFAHVFLARRNGEINRHRPNLTPILWGAAGALVALFVAWWAGMILMLVALYHAFARQLTPSMRRRILIGASITLAFATLVVLALHWEPLGPEKGLVRNLLFAAIIVGGALAAIHLLQKYYIPILRWCLGHKTLFLAAPVALVFLGALIWLGFESIFGWLPQRVRVSAPVSAFGHAFPGLQKEFMPPLDEGAFLWMPTTMPHAGIGESIDILQKQDALIASIPEISSVVGKLGRVESALDPAPTSMFETVINYRAEYARASDGSTALYQFDPDRVDTVRDSAGQVSPAPDGTPYLRQGSYSRSSGGANNSSNALGALIPDNDGAPFRHWRVALDTALNQGRSAWGGVKSPEDIFGEISRMAEMPGVTSAPKLQPIMTRIIMLQTGMRASMGVKITGSNLESIERFALDIERALKEHPLIEPASVVADRVIGKPYLEISLDRRALAQYGVQVEDALMVIETALGGATATMTVEGRERYAVRVRYAREMRDNPDAIMRALVMTAGRASVPLSQLSTIRYSRGPEMIKSENSFQLGYVIFDKRPGGTDVETVESAKIFLEENIASGAIPQPDGVSFTFAGDFENQARAQKKLATVIPLSLLIILGLLYYEFRRLSTTLNVFTGVFVASAGAFLMLWLYGQDWFLDFSMFGVGMRDLFQVHPVNLSVAVWVGFLALFGVATNDGVIISTYLEQSFARLRPQTVAEIREAVLAGAARRIRPALMTVATTIIALVPALTAHGRGADVMVPMAIPSFGGMTIAILTVLTVPTVYCFAQERRLARADVIEST